MIIVNDVIQGSDEWLSLRCGVITASEINNIITSTGRDTKDEKYKTYIRQKAGEIISGRTDSSYSGGYMQKGLDMEDEARNMFMMHEFKHVSEVGFIFKDEDKRVGCSPDGLSINSGLEIKCPKISTHIKYLQQSKVPSEYIPQIMFSMYVTDLKYWHFMSYCEGLNPLIIKVSRDDEYIKTIDDNVKRAILDIDEIVSEIGGTI